MSTYIKPVGDGKVLRMIVYYDEVMIRQCVKCNFVGFHIFITSYSSTYLSILQIFRIAIIHWIHWIETSQYPQYIFASFMYVNYTIFKIQLKPVY